MLVNLSSFAAKHLSPLPLDFSFHPFLFPRDQLIYSHYPLRDVDSDECTLLGSPSLSSLPTPCCGSHLGKNPLHGTSLQPCPACFSGGCPTLQGISLAPRWDIWSPSTSHCHIPALALLSTQRRTLLCYWEGKQLPSRVNQLIVTYIADKPFSHLG